MKLTVCNGFSCRDKGAEFILEDLRRLISRHKLDDAVELTARSCMGKCKHGVCVTLDGAFYSLLPSDTQTFFEEQILPKVK